MAKLVNLYLGGKFPVSTNRLNHFDRLFGQALFGSVEKSVDYAPIISITDALAKPALEVLCKITAIQEGSGDPSPNNIRNIIGFSGLSLFHASVNKFDATTATTFNRYINVNTSKWVYSADSRSVYLPVENGKTYTVSLAGKSGLMRIAFSDSTSAPTDVFDIVADGNTNQLTSAENNNHDYLIIQVGAGIFDKNNIIVTESAPTEISVSWEDEAGIIYGGTLNFTDGTLTVTNAIRDLSVPNWSITSGVFIMSSNFFSDALLNFKSAMCTCYKFNGNANATDAATMASRLSDKQICVYSNATNRGRLVIKDSDVETASALKESLSGQYIVFPLRESITYQLSPSEVVLLAGNNTLWNTAGDTSLKYMAKR